MSTYPHNGYLCLRHHHFDVNGKLKRRHSISWPTGAEVYAFPDPSGPGNIFGSDTHDDITAPPWMEPSPRGGFDEIKQ